MGQQQLLLLVLGIVIVGIAVVAGIQAFSEGKVKAEQDAAVSDAMRIISDIQAWKLKPGAFGGGSDLDGASNFTGVDYRAIGYPVVNNDKYATYNGCYELDGTDAGATITVYQDGDTNPTAGADGELGTDDDVQETTCTEGSEIATVTVTGTSTDKITWVYDGAAN